MKILLADAPQLFLEGMGLSRQVQPLGLGYVGAFLLPDHQVRILLPDTRAYVGIDPWGEIRAAMAAETPELLGISSVSATFPAAARLAAEAKRQSPEIITVLGGVHATSDPVGALSGAPAIDFLVRGEGEETMRALVSGLGHSSFRAESVPGLYFRNPNTGKIDCSAPRDPIPNLDRLPFPLRENLVWDSDIHISFYQGIMTQRGCSYHCIYCAVPGLSTRQVRFRSPSAVVEEIGYLQQKFQVPGLFFHDSVFTQSRKRTMALCRLMILQGSPLPYSCQTRVERVDPELLDLMKAAGCSQIFFGIESGDPQSLKRIGKNPSLETIRRSVEMVRGRGIRCTGFFMIGFPWETEALMEKTADFATGIGLDAVNLFSATPLPGTVLWEHSKARQVQESVDFRTPQVNLTRLPNEAYRHIFSRIENRFAVYNEKVMMEKFIH